MFLKRKVCINVSDKCPASFKHMDIRCWIFLKDAVYV
jgi:hypothetical protein